MDIIYKRFNYVSGQTDALVFAIYEKQVKSEVFKQFDLHLNKQLSALQKQGIIKGKKNEINVVYTNSLCKVKKLVIVGLGKENEVNYDGFRQAAGNVARKLKAIKAKQSVFLVPTKLPLKVKPGLLCQSITEGLILGNYSFREFKKSKPDDPVFEIGQIKLSFDKSSRYQVSQSIKNGAIIANSVCLARDLANMPANVLTPFAFMEKAKALVKERKNLKIKVFTADEMKKKGMNALLGVAQGSANDPYLVAITYQPPKSANQPIAVVGKGVLFDSGGISLKPSKGMGEMKGDMSGAAAVLASVVALADLGTPNHVLALLPLVENMPSGTAQRPGDIVKAANGKTIEILNTDAEGRLILADALCYAVEQKATQIIDIATLTGACLYALGKLASAILGNNQQMIDKMRRVSEFTGERLWQLPLYDEYIDELESSVADIANCGEKGLAGTSTAAKFLEQFVDKKPWIHLDIASTEGSSKTAGYQVKGMTGTNVRNLIGYLS